MDLLRRAQSAERRAQSAERRGFPHSLLLLPAVCLFLFSIGLIGLLYILVFGLDFEFKQLFLISTLNEK
jgi:hypothetical protein